MEKSPGGAFKRKIHNKGGGEKGSFSLQKERRDDFLAETGEGKLSMERKKSVYLEDSL